jgi:asparagine synthetase B (glutamine-hydrolysing)
LGLIREVLDEGVGFCGQVGPDGTMQPDHDYIVGKNGKHTCVACGRQYRYQFVLLDLKTSNQFKDHYFFQVAMYWWMFWKIIGIDHKPEKCLILKVSKEDGRYKIEDLKMPARLAGYAKHMLRTKEGMEFIRELRKDNQRNVVKI